MNHSHQNKAKKKCHFDEMSEEELRELNKKYRRLKKQSGFLAKLEKEQRSMRSQMAWARSKDLI